MCEKMSFRKTPTLSDSSLHDPMLVPVNESHIDHFSGVTIAHADEPGNEKSGKKSERLLSLDALRGLVVSGCVL